VALKVWPRVPPNNDLQRKRIATTGTMSKSKVIFSHRIDAADFADGQKTCCLLPMRWGAMAFASLFATAGILQLYETIYVMKYQPQDILSGPIGEAIIFILAACMALSGVSGILGVIFQIRFPITMFCLLLLVQVILELCWFVLVERSDSTHPPLKAIALMVWNELLKGNRDNKSTGTVASHLFYTLFAVQFHLWATAIVASYALELRIEGKTVWFEPVVDDNEDDDVEATQAPLVDKKGNHSGTDYGATEDIQQKA